MKKTPPLGRKRKGGNWFKYEFAFMRKVVQDYLDGHESMKEVAMRHGLAPACVRSWMQRYNKGHEPFNVVTLIPVETEHKIDDNNPELQKLTAELQKKLEQANLKITGLEIMIDLAEETFGIEIRKNSGAKQSEDCANTTPEQA